MSTHSKIQELTYNYEIENSQHKNVNLQTYSTLSYVTTALRSLGVSYVRAVVSGILKGALYVHMNNAYFV